MGVRLRRAKRREALRDALVHNPFLRDEELARQFDVSVSTVRLDRMEMGIPEVRERTRAVASEAYANLKALGEQEVIGELLELSVGQRARSELYIREDMILNRGKVARGHHLFAQANSLAAALVDAEVALTASAGLRFIRPVLAGERVVMEAQVVKRQDNKYWVDVRGKVGERLVVQGAWMLTGLPAPLKEGADQ